MVYAMFLYSNCEAWYSEGGDGQEERGTLCLIPASYDSSNL
jgi:hypothetical protein